MKLTGVDIATATGGVLSGEGGFGQVLTDTRGIVPGAWFLAIRGASFDGHDFVEAAAAAGAGGVVVSREVPFWTGAQVRVPDTTLALQDLGRFARAAYHGPVVGLTGSAGKTTTRALIALALEPLGPVHQTVGNLNNHWGVPMTLLAAPDDAAALVVEMGTSGPGEIAVLADIARPTVRLVLNIGPSHLLELGGPAGVAREKGVLFASASAGDTLVVNLDDAAVAAMPRPEGVRVLTFGARPEADVRIEGAVLDGLVTVVTLQTPDGPCTVRLGSPGLHLASNVAAALACAYALGVNTVAAAQNLARYQPVGMRMRVEDLGGVTVLNDAYNANPTSMSASLRALASLPGRRVAIIGSMLELGDEEDRLHADIARLAGELGLDRVVLVGEQMCMAAPCCVGARALDTFPDPEDVAPELARWLRPGDHVLLKGSRGVRMERILAGLREQRG